MKEKTSLEIYKNKDKPKKENFYNGSWESSLLFKARTKSLEINERIKRWGEGPEHCQIYTKKTDMSQVGLTEKPITVANVIAT